MALAIFDLDHTLLDGDSDQLWGPFLAEKAGLDPESHIRRSQQFYQDYLDGALDIETFMEFALQPLSKIEMSTLEIWRQEYVENIIRPLILPKAVELIAKHRSQGDTLMIITATNRFITEPIAKLFDIPNLLATQPEVKNGQFTGRYVGIPTFREGKVTVLREWIELNSSTLEGSFFYSDSANDIPLLEVVDNPVATNPDASLREHAVAKNWPILLLA